MVCYTSEVSRALLDYSPLPKICFLSIHRQGSPRQAGWLPPPPCLIDGNDRGTFLHFCEREYLLHAIEKSLIRFIFFLLPCHSATRYRSVRMFDVLGRFPTKSRN